MAHFSKTIAFLIFSLAAGTFANSIQEKTTYFFQCPNKELGYFPNSEDCSAYYLCIDGEVSLQRCPEGTLYNHDLTICDLPGNVNCHDGQAVTRNPAVMDHSMIGPDPDYNCTRNGAFPHTTACELFYICWEGEATLNTCIDQQLFDLRYSGCNYANYTDCGDRERPDGYPGTVTPPAPTTTRGPTTTGNPNQTTTTGEPDAGYNCTVNGAFPHPIYCERYYTCYEGEDTLHTCYDTNEGYLFDLRYNGCNFPEYTDCQDRQRPPGVPGTITPPVGTGPTSTTRRPGYFQCPEAEGLFPDPEDCASFFQCAEWNDYHYTCPRPLLYNPAVVSCDHPINVDCGDRPRP